MDAQRGTNQNRDAFEALAPYFGKPRRRDFDFDNFFHPAFGHAHYFEREDAGYHEGGTPGYSGSTCRGAHISIPGFDEMGGFQVIDLSSAREPPTSTCQLRRWPRLLGGARTTRLRSRLQLITQPR